MIELLQGTKAILVGFALLALLALWIKVKVWGPFLVPGPKQAARRGSRLFKFGWYTIEIMPLWLGFVALLCNAVLSIVLWAAGLPLLFSLGVAGFALVVFLFAVSKPTASRKRRITEPFVDSKQSPPNVRIVGSPNRKHDDT